MQQCWSSQWRLSPFVAEALPALGRFDASRASAEFLDERWTHGIAKDDGRGEPGEPLRNPWLVTNNGPIHVNLWWFNGDLMGIYDDLMVI